MTIKRLTQQRWTETTTLTWSWDIPNSDGGYCISQTDQRPIGEHMNPEVRAQMLALLDAKPKVGDIQILHGKQVRYAGVIDCTRDVRIPATGRCECGVVHDLSGHDFCCDCGREYNGSGQELRKGWTWDDNANEAIDYANEG